MYNTMYHTTTATEEETQYVTETKKMPPKISTITTTEEGKFNFCFLLSISPHSPNPRLFPFFLPPYFFFFLSFTCLISPS